jgi:hypothetical protein
MTEFTYMGMTTDPEGLRDIAQAVDEDADDWRARVDALPVYMLTAETLASPPSMLAEHLRGVAKFLEDRRDGVPFGGHEFAAQMAARAPAGPTQRRRKRGR